MRKRYGCFSFGLILLLALGVPLIAQNSAKDSANSNSIVITFRDGHQQTFSLAEIAKIEFKPQAGSVAKMPGSSAELPRREAFIGRWQVGDGHGHFYHFTFQENGEATNDVPQSGHGKWTYVKGELRVEWDNGWHDVIRKVGTKYKKYAYAPGVPFINVPDHVADAEKTEPI
ncbi:MAG TPA: hypothetical protein VMT82_06950 [candidate division Zixibacteria bacterium]|nr:hypothetical protein [candidate division Zixibacteria bacterium]